MTRLLVSVRSVDEALVAAAAGVDLIDVKEPSRGPLGMADAEVRRAIGQRLGHQHHISAACGELRDWNKASWSKEDNSSWINYRYAKIGLANCGDKKNWRSNWLAWRQALPTNVEPVLVSYADGNQCNAPSFHDLLEFARENRISMFLFDTFAKDGPGLCQLWKTADFMRISQELRQAGIRYVLAGKLALDNVHALTPYEPEYLGVRGAVCIPLDSNSDLRSGILSQEKIKSWQLALRTRTVGTAVPVILNGK